MPIYLAVRLRSLLVPAEEAAADLILADIRVPGFQSRQGAHTRAVTECAQACQGASLKTSRLNICRKSEQAARG
jgi:hypothetical protein